MAADDFNWNLVQLDWDGDGGFTLHVPHRMADWPGRWLARRLHMPLRAVHDGADVRVIVTPRAHGEDWGDLSIGPITLPLHSGRSGAADKLRQIVERESERADAEAEAAYEHAKALIEGLRRQHQSSTRAA